MNGVVACTLLNSSTKESGILRLYKSGPKLTWEDPSNTATGSWDWIGGTFRPQDALRTNTVNSGTWILFKNKEVYILETLQGDSRVLESP
jgi:hypothetical protein